MTALHALLADHAHDAGEVVVGIETDRGPWVAALVGAGYRIYAINPRVAALYRERHQVGGGKSDKGDARMLANLVRTDSHNHRPVAGDDARASAVQVRARAQQQLVWNRTRASNRLRSALLQYSPAALQAFPLTHPDALAVLAAAPQPLAAAKLTRAQIRGALRRGGRRRNLDTRAEEIRKKLRLHTLRLAPALSEAFSDSALAQVAQHPGADHGAQPRHQRATHAGPSCPPGLGQSPRCEALALLVHEVDIVMVFRPVVAHKHQHPGAPSTGRMRRRNSALMAFSVRRIRFGAGLRPRLKHPLCVVRQ